MPLPNIIEVYYILRLILIIYGTCLFFFNIYGIFYHLLKNI
jgi:hypothetical protein